MPQNQQSPHASPESAEAGRFTRLSVNMTDETANALEELATHQHISRTEVIRRAVALMKFIEDEQDRGRKVLTMDSDEKHVRELVLV